MAGLDMNMVKAHTKRRVSLSEALANITPVEWPEDVLSGEKKVVINKAQNSERNLNALRYTLEKEHIGQYCILGKKEWKVCIQQESGKWKVSFIERNNDVSPAFYENVNDACLDLIRRITPKYKMKKVISNYQKQVGNEPNIEMNDIKTKLVDY